jgi:Mg/Co/Ni transporter MgtE
MNNFVLALILTIIIGTAIKVLKFTFKRLYYNNIDSKIKKCILEIFNRHFKKDIFSYTDEETQKITSEIMEALEKKNLKKYITKMNIKKNADILNIQYKVKNYMTNRIEFEKKL